MPGKEHSIPGNLDRWWPVPAEALVTGAAVLLAVGDVFLTREGARTVTDVLRRPLPAVGLGVLCAHVADVLGPVDPFRLLGGWLSGRADPAVPVG